MFAPVAVNAVDCPAQMLTSVPALVDGSGFTVTTKLDEAVHPLALVPTIVYVVVFPAVKSKGPPVIPLKLVAGDHV